MKMVGIKIIADNQEFTYEEFKKYLEKITDEKREPTLQDKVKIKLEDELYQMYKSFVQLHTKDRDTKPFLDDWQDIIRILGVQLYGMLKLQKVADLVNEGKQFAIQDNCYGIAYSFPEGKPEVVNWTGFKTQIGSPRFKDEQAALKAIELMNIPYFEGDITLEELR
jgi:hypothetical protein